MEDHGHAHHHHRHRQEAHSRGRGKKRGGSRRSSGAAAAAAAAPLTHLDRGYGLPPPHSCLPPAVDSEDEEEDAEFRREAAQLAERAQQQELPPGLSHDKLRSAIRHLCQAGLTPSLAEDALKATAEEHHADWEGWIDAAMMWLALQQEVQMEAEKMKQAMEESLREQQALREAAAATAPPLANLSEERLRRRFAGSELLAGLEGLLPGGLLFSDAPHLRAVLKFPLVELLRLEADCCKWWPGDGTTSYFKAFAARVAHELKSTRSSCSQIAGEPPTTQQQQQQQQRRQESSPAPRLKPLLGGPEQPQQQQQPPDQLRVSVASEQQTDDSRGGSVRLSAEPTLSAAAAASPADGPGSRQRSTRKRQLPSRYRSPGPEATSGKRRRTPDPLPSLPDGGAGGPGAAAGCSSHCSSALEREGAEKGTAQPALAAPTPAAPAPAALVGAVQPQEQQQGGPPQQPQPVAGSGSGHSPVAVQQLSRLLEAERQVLQAAVFTMPCTAGAVPDIFKLPGGQEAEEPDADSEGVEVVDEVDAAAAAAAIAAAAASAPFSAAAAAAEAAAAAAEAAAEAAEAAAAAGDAEGEFPGVAAARAAAMALAYWAPAPGASSPIILLD